MIAAQLHLVLNHISLIGIPIALFFLLVGIFRKYEPLKHVALIVLIGLAVILIPTYLTGEPTEHHVENILGITENQIEPHSESAEVSLALTLLAGALSAIALLCRKTPLYTYAIYGVLVASVVASGSLAVTCHEGGKIRHSELSAPVGNAAP